MSILTLCTTDANILRMAEALYSVHHLLVATPGRLVELLATHAVALERVTLLTIDEADRMMDLGFEEQLNVISQAIRPDRQTLLFSATFPCVLHLYRRMHTHSSPQLGPLNTAHTSMF